MPAFIRTKKDEANWNKAKEAAGKTLSESDGDSFWALTNSIYQKMTKAKEELEKARKKLSDEYDPNEDPYESEDDLGEGFHEIDPENDGSEADDWLKENDPNYGKHDEYEMYDHDEDPDEHISSIKEDMGEDEPEEAISQPAQPKSKSRFDQPSREDLVAMRSYTRPWEQRARDAARVQADPTKNPVLAHHGGIIEAREKHFGDRKSAYQSLVNSDEYKKADPITQMEMDDKFEKEWSSKNPAHLSSAMQAHHTAHQKESEYGGRVGRKGQGVFDAAKEAKIQNVISGGAQAPETFSTEAGLQHAGGTKGEEGTQGTIVNDPAASFAAGNKEFIQQYAKDYAAKGKKPINIDDISNYDSGSQKDIARILGPGPAKDPKFEKFFAHYYPLIGMSAKKAINALGLDPKHPDIDASMLHEAGMHGLVQAINDYDHDNPGKASFATHAGNKIRGLQMTAMRNIDQIPTEVRQAQKQHAAKGKIQQLVSHPKFADAPKVQENLKRIDAARTTQAGKTLRRTGAEAQPKKITSPITVPNVEIPEDGEE